MKDQSHSSYWNIGYISLEGACRAGAGSALAAAYKADV